ncbi:Eukaryotic aspartyl protease [Aphelenchoides besseyi]|nr:Eukaryotic aspartyl protease [Aphelenchoides besseyi]
MMRSMVSIVVFILLIVNVSAFVSTDGKSNWIVAKTVHRNAADLRAYHKEGRSRRKNYIPNYPSESVIASIQIGELEEEFVVSVETATIGLWVLDYTYPYVDTNLSTFWPDGPYSSAVYKGEYDGYSGDYKILGNAYYDTVNVVNPRNQSFGSVFGVWSSNLDPVFNGPVSGVLGLGWNVLLANETVTPDSAPILNIFDSFSSPLPRYYIQYIRPDREHGGRVGYSTIIFGNQFSDGCNSTIVTTASLSFYVERNILAFHLDSFSIRDRRAIGGTISVDSGLPIILLPLHAFFLVYDLIEPKYDYDLGVYTTNCSKREKLDDFVFTIGAKDLTVPSTSYIFELDIGDNRCVVAFDNSQNYYSTSYALGIPFQYNYCVKFDVDNSEISFQNAFFFW